MVNTTAKAMLITHEWLSRSKNGIPINSIGNTGFHAKIILCNVFAMDVFVLDAKQNTFIKILVMFATTIEVATPLTP
jgi:hypothetical protein